ncbi:hypothetical protein P4O66_003083 [Electrophorus voltai]|uniref:Reverse transcriptase domain-containing protein n=1 Tax=Electrophorus voltai TaxID=2609070 RepID=A0AAD9DL76_9TELE|nr:hypothetical protein P4O66_003083 [Electrophorus voltai]
MQTGTFNAKMISKLGTWNVRTLCEGGKLAQLLHEFDNYNLDILGISKMRWTGSGKIREQKQQQCPYAVEKLKEPAAVQQFQLELRNRFELLQDAGDIDEYWMAFKQAVKETVKETVGRRHGTKKERWIRDPTWSLIDERKIAKCRCEQAKADPDKETTAEQYQQLDRAVKRSCKSDKKEWLECKGAEVHGAASKNDNKMLYRIVRELTGAWSNSSAPIKNKDGVFLLTREEQDARWVEHFKETLNQPTPANTYDFGATLPPPDLVVNLDLITIEETKVAIRTLKANKAPGLDDKQTAKLNSTHMRRKQTNQKLTLRPVQLMQPLGLFSVHQLRCSESLWLC